MTRLELLYYRLGEEGMKIRLIKGAWIALGIAAFVVAGEAFRYEDFPGAQSPGYEWWKDIRPVITGAIAVGGVSIPMSLWLRIRNRAVEEIKRELERARAE